MKKNFCFIALMLASGNLLAEVDVGTMDAAAKAQGAQMYNNDTLVWCSRQGAEIDVERVMDEWTRRNGAVLDAAEKIVQEGESYYPNVRETISNNARRHSDNAIAAVAKMSQNKKIDFCLGHARSIERGDRDLNQEKFRALVEFATRIS